MMIDELFKQLLELVTTLGGILTVVLISFILFVASFWLYMILKFGENAFSLLLPFIREYLNLIREELKISHPAVRLELLMHGFFALIFLFSVVTIVLHALTPWLPEHTHNTIVALLISSFVILVLLMIPSFLVAPRVPRSDRG